MSANENNNNNNNNNNDNNQNEIDIDFSSSDSSFKDSKTNLIVNYLPQTLTSDELKMLFTPYGKIQTCKLIYDKISGESLCYGFVDFVNIDDAEKAVVQLNGCKVQNKIIKVTFARPSCESIKGANLYVCGIPKHWSVLDLNNYFSQCGEVITSRILTHQNNQSKGVGFIRFDKRSEADLALSKLNNTFVAEDSTESISIKFANYPAAITNKQMAALPLAASFYAPAKAQILNATSMNLLRPQATQLTQSTTYGPLTAAYNSFAAAAAAAAAVAASNYLPTNDFNHANIQNPNQTLNAINNSIANNFTAIQNITVPSNTDMLTPSTGWCLFVYNLSPDTEDNILWQLFGPFGAVQHVKIVREYKTQKCKGFGFVTMTNYEEALIAINALNGFPLGNRALQVSFKTNHQTF